MNKLASHDWKRDRCYRHRCGRLAAYHQPGSHSEFEWLYYDLYIQPREQIRKVRHVQHVQQQLADLHSIAYKHRIKDLWIFWRVRDEYEMTPSSFFCDAWLSPQ